MTADDLRALAREHKTRGYRIIADGWQSSYRTAPAAARALSTVRGRPDEIYRNWDKELTFDFGR